MSKIGFWENWEKVAKFGIFRAEDQWSKALDDLRDWNDDDDDYDERILTLGQAVSKIIVKT